MATKQERVQWDGTSSLMDSSARKISVPGAKRINSITTVPELQVSNIQQSFDPVKGEVTVTLKGVPSTSSGPQTTMYPLVSSNYNQSTGRWSCTYGNGETVTTALACATSRGSTIVVHSYNYLVVVDYDTNVAPTLTLETTDNRTLYENDTFNLTGKYNDVDTGNVMSVKYAINNGTVRALASAISDGVEKTFNRVLTYRNNKLYDGQTILTPELQEGAQHVVKVWAEDDQGGKSAEQTRIFYVVANRAPLLTMGALTPVTGLLNTGAVKYEGTVSDPDGNDVKVEYKVRNGSWTEIYNGKGGAFEFTVGLSALNAGNNAVSVRATDSYNATTTRTLNVEKGGTSVPLKESPYTYRITPPNGSAQGVLVWAQRETGDLEVSAEISMTNPGEPENYVPMTLNSTAFVNGSVEEDEFFYEYTEGKSEILVQLHMKRENPASTAGIILVNGVLS